MSGDGTAIGHERRWLWVIIVVLIALLLLVLAFWTVHNNPTPSAKDKNADITAEVTTVPVVPPTTVIGTDPRAGSTFTYPTTPTSGVTTGPTISVQPTDRRPPVTSPSTKLDQGRTPSAAPQTGGGSLGPGDGVIPVVTGLALVLGAILVGAFAMTRWRRVRFGP